MITGFSTIRIEVPDLQAAEHEYQWLLDAGSGKVAALRNVEIELRESAGLKTARITTLGLVDDGESGSAKSLANLDRRGLQLEIHNQHRSSPTPPNPSGVAAVDHLVLQTGDADACVRLFGEQGLGLRLALDQSVPEWGGRMVFFRCGKMTLEIIHKLEEPPEQDFFWGITYLCEDLDASLRYLDGAGVAHSPARAGRKPGSRVATVKSHTLGLPTLLIEHSA